MRKLLGFILIALMATTINAQTPGTNNRPQVTGRFYGKVVDAGNKGVEAASVALVQIRMDAATKQNKEVIVGGMLTAANGDFSIENVPAMGKYKLRITGIGFKTYEADVAFDMPGRNADPAMMMAGLDKDLGNIKLEIDQQVLGNVTVASTRAGLQMGIDRKVFNVDKDLTSAGGTAVDVMKNVPSVNVDIDGNVTLRNNAPQIFVDGRPSNLTLEQIPADAIESIEIITNPSAKFDASGGTSGILNIVLKKNKRVGYSGNLRTNIDSRARVGFGGDINIRQDKINFFANGNFNQRKSISEGSTDRRTFGDTTNHTFQNDNSEFLGAMGFGRVGFDYFINNRSTITLTGTFGRHKMKPFNSSIIDNYFISGNDTINSELNKRFSNSDNMGRNLGAQLSFKHIFPKAGREWTADATYNRSRNENENLIRTDYYVTNDYIYDRTYRQQQFGRGDNENLILQTDYVNPLSENSKLEVGARTTIRTVNSANNFYRLGPDYSLIPIPGQDVVYNSKDQVYAAYATFSNRIKNFGYQLGLRAESSKYTGELVNKGQDFEIEFPISLFPSVFVNQKISDNDELQLNYSRRINRPNFWQLYPFTDYSDSLNISRGNPNLRPEFTNSIELSYSKMFKNRDNFIASLYFKNTNDLITSYQTREVDTFLKKNVIVSSYINANKSYVTGLELTGKNKITKFWDLTSSVNFFTSKIDLEDQPDPDQLFSYFIKINNSFRLPKNFSIQLSGDYQSRRISNPGGRGGGGGGFGGPMFGGASSSAQGYIRSNYGVDAGLRYEFLKERRASISVNVNDIFRTRKFDSHTESAFFVQDIVRRRDPQVVRVNFNFRFGKFDANLFKRKNTKAANEGMDSGVNF